MTPAAEAILARLLGPDLTDMRRLGGQHGVAHYRLRLGDGRSAFAKIDDHDGNARWTPPVAADDPCGFLAEAAGLRWLGEAGAVPVPPVVAAGQDALVVGWLDADAAAAGSAAVFGRELARLHATGAPSFGARPPSARWPGQIAGLPLPDEAAQSWPQWYAQYRVLPYVRIGRDRGVLSAAEARLIEAAAARAPAAAGPPEPPSRIHGDCWSGNVLWSRGRGWLIDPAAHGGHRETDLAMLALFGAPHLARILAAYREVAPLADGWRERVPLHQLHPLLVHVCLFGEAYLTAALAAARAVPG